MVSPISNPSPVVRSSALAESSVVSSGAAGPSRELPALPDLPRWQFPSGAHSQSARGFDESSMRRVGRTALPMPSAAARFASDAEALLPAANLFGRSDRFEASPTRQAAPDVVLDIDRLSMRSNSSRQTSFPSETQATGRPDFVVDMSRLTEASALNASRRSRVDAQGDSLAASSSRAASHGSVRSNAPVATPRERVVTALGTIDFHAPAGEARAAEVAMEALYVDWAAKVLEAREKAFGSGSYALGQDRSIALGEAALPAMYDGARQFISSISRSPVRNAVATWLGPHRAGTDASGQRLNAGELNNNYDPALAGGVAGAATAHAVDTALLSAMDRRARLANFPEFKAVDLKALVPDPAPVQLRMVQGRKEYWRPRQDEPGALDAAAPAGQGTPSMAALKDKAEGRRKLLSDVQDMLEAKQWGMLAQPVLAGAFNVLRRASIPKEALLLPLPVLGHSMWASGLGGASAKLTLGLAKSAAWADVDNLVGGRQRVNLFATKVANPDVRPAALSDIRGLPGHAWEVTKEAASLAAHFTAGPWRESGTLVPSREAVQARVGDVARTVVSNVLASVLSTATGPLVAQILRNGASAPLTGESARSGAYLLQQAAQSATNDFVWQASKEALRGGAYNLGASLDRWRDNKQAQWLNTAHVAQNELPGLATRLQRVADTLPVGGASQAHAALAEMRSLGRDQNVRVDVAQRALTALKDLPALAAADPQLHAGLVQRAETVIRSMAQRNELKRWRDPMGAQAQADRSR